MNMTDMITLVMERLGKRTSLSLRTAVAAEANEVIRSLETLPWCPWFLFKRREYVLPAGFATLELDTRILRQNEDYPVLYWVSEEDYAQSYIPWKPLERRDPAQAFADTSTGDRPLYWAPEPGYDTNIFRISPIPTVAGQVAVQGYFASPLFEEAAIEHPWVTHAYRWLVNEVVAAMANGYLHHPELAERAKAEANAENLLHYRKSVEFAVSQMDLVKGE